MLAVSMNGQRAPRDSRYRRLIRGGEGRLVDVIPRTGGCGLNEVKLATSDVHASLSCGGDRRHPSRRVMATVPRPLRGQSHVDRPKGAEAVSEDDVAIYPQSTRPERC